MKKGSVSILLLFILYSEAFSGTKCETPAALTAVNHRPHQEQENQLKADNEAIRKSCSNDHKDNDKLAKVNELDVVVKAKVNNPAYGGAQMNRPHNSKSNANSNLDKLSSFSVTTRQMFLGLLLRIFFF